MARAAAGHDRPRRADVARTAPPLVALADEPRRQTQYPVGWNLDEGNLLLFGIPGSGTTTALASLVLSLATVQPPEQLEVYALDNGNGDLRALETLPHTGSVILAGDRERQMRLIRRLRRVLDERRTAGGKHATTVVLIDNLAALRSEFDDVAGLELMDELARVYADGPQAGIYMAVTADRPNTRPDVMDGRHHPEVALPARRSLRLRLARADRQGRAVRDARPRGDGRDQAAHPARAAGAVGQRRRRHARRPLRRRHAVSGGDRRPSHRGLA